MAKMTRVTLCYNHFMIVQAWWWTPDDPSDSNLLGGTCFEMMLSNMEHHNIATCNLISNSVRFKRQSNWAFQRFVLQVVQVEMVCEASSCIIHTHCADKTGRLLRQQWPFCYRQIACFLKAWQVLAWSSKGNQGCWSIFQVMTRWLVWIEMF